jgi:hypothetical protein
VNLIDLVYEAPNRIRVDISGPDSQQSSWLVGSHNVSRGTSKGKSLHWEVDFDELYAPWLALEDRIDGTLAARTREASSQAGQELSVRLVVDARFDDATGDGSLDFMAYTQRENDGPFSWLSALRDRAEEPHVDADQIHFKTAGGRAEFVVSTKTGFLERFTATGPNATAIVELESLVLDQPVQRDRLDPPIDPPSGEDVSRQFAETVHRTLADGSRSRIYRAASSVLPAGPLDQAARTRIESTLREVHELRLSRTIDELLELNRSWVDHVVTVLAQMRLGGSPKEEVDATRADARMKTNARLSLAKEKLFSVTVPDHGRPNDRDADVLVIERALLEQFFEERLRDPALSDFDQETAG